LLDEITRLKYEGLIPESAKINGHRRNVLISQFRHWKGENYIPPHIHSSIAWSQNDPFISSPKANDTQWHIVSKVKRNNKNSEQGPEHSTFIMAKGTVPFSNPTSNKRKSADELEQPTLKRMKIVSSINTCPRGLQWDNVNFSCAYDALFSVLLEMWSSNSNEWSTFFKSVNKYMVMLADGFQMHAHERISLEAVRDGIRAHLNNMDSEMFPMGAVGTRVADLAHMMLSTSVPVAEIDIECMGCRTSQPSPRALTSYFIEFQSAALNIQGSDSVARILGRFLSMEMSRKCNSCNATLKRNIYFEEVPRLLVFHVPYTAVKINPRLRIGDRVLKLRGVVYHGGYHYTARLVSSDESVWYHDGIHTGNMTSSHGPLNKLKHDLNKCKGRQVALVVYGQE